MKIELVRSAESDLKEKRGASPLFQGGNEGVVNEGVIGVVVRVGVGLEGL
jgi:hypothetical protein